MNTQIVIVVASVIASIFMGTISNWVYDLLRNRGFFPDKPTLKAVAVIILASLPFFVLIILPEVFGQVEIAPWMLIYTTVSIPLWLGFLITASTILIGYLVGRRNIKALIATLENMERERRNLEEQKEVLERRLDQCLESGRLKPEEPIIRPK